MQICILFKLMCPSTRQHHWKYFCVNVLIPISSNVRTITFDVSNRKWQDYVYIQCEYKSTKQKIKHLLREEWCKCKVCASGTLSASRIRKFSAIFRSTISSSSVAQLFGESMWHHRLCYNPQKEMCCIVRPKYWFVATVCYHWVVDCNS